jgi:uncharacterized membrane protein
VLVLALVLVGPGARHVESSCGARGASAHEPVAALEQIPSKRIAWTSTSGARNAGVVTFHRLGDDTCRVTLQIDYEPEGVVENLGDLFGVMSSGAEGDLERFKEFIESRGRETGAWRGEIPSPDETASR